MTNTLSPASASIKKGLFGLVSTETFKLVQVLLFGLTLWYFFQPEALADSSWRLFVIFVSTIFAIVIKPLPMGAIALIAICLLPATKTLAIDTILQGFASELIWLILMACFLARAFIKTGLGKRIAYVFISYCGASPLGLSYGLLLSSTTLASLIPSATARTGGIILPVLESLIRVVRSEQTAEKSKKIAQFLTLTVFHGSVVASALFITGNAGNPVSIKFAQNIGIPISWSTWTLGAIVPALVTLALLPLLLKFLCPCSIDNKEKISEHAKQELASMGKVTNQEKGLLAVFGLLLLLWSCGSIFHILPTEAALFGVGLLILFRILKWKDIINEEMAWDTFFWLSILIMMATELQKLGVMTFFTNKIVCFLPVESWPLTLLMLTLIYFYSHYLFASTTAHISSMFAPFLAIAISTGAPPVPTALLFSYLSNLFGGLTHYSSGPAPILYAQGHVELKTWWKIGAITSLFYLLVWLGIGSLWWKILGFF